MIKWNKPVELYINRKWVPLRVACVDRKFEFPVLGLYCDDASGEELIAQITIDGCVLGFIGSIRVRNVAPWHFEKRWVIFHAERAEAYATFDEAIGAQDVGTCTVCLEVDDWPVENAK